MISLTYVLPLRDDTADELAELTAYVNRLATKVAEVIVVDNSSPPAFVRHHAAFTDEVRVLRPDEVTLMGKVGNVMTGVRHASYERVVIADDDVRYDATSLRRVAALLDDAVVVRPQNYFEPRCWHTDFESARIVVNRCAGGDWPGTLGVRRSALLRAGGYSGEVMFENLELVRTVRAGGGREHVALDVLVARRPPTTPHFWRQQVRQAYDEFARPSRLVASLAVMPLVAWGAIRRRWRAFGVAAAAGVLVAECGRRRAGGRAVFPARASLLAPLWLTWRSCCTWVALGARARGGVRYRGRRITTAATSMRKLRRAQSSRCTVSGENAGTHTDTYRAPLGAGVE